MFNWCTHLEEGTPSWKKNYTYSNKGRRSNDHLISTYNKQIINIAPNNIYRKYFPTLHVVSHILKFTTINNTRVIIWIKLKSDMDSSASTRATRNYEYIYVCISLRLWFILNTQYIYYFVSYCIRITCLYYNLKNSVLTSNILHRKRINDPVGMPD